MPRPPPLSHCAHPRLLRLLFAGFVVGAFTIGILWNRQHTKESSAALTREAYLWQHHWNDNVRESISKHGSDFSSLVFLGSEISLIKGVPTLKKIDIDWQLLAQSNQPFGIAIRCGNIFQADVAKESVPTLLVSEAQRLLKLSEDVKLSLTEFQIDFDCPESRLKEYAELLHELASCLPPHTKLTATALPAWLDRPSAQTLFRSADSWVLQVHTLDKPSSKRNVPPIIDLVQARQAVSRMSLFDVPFRVALPTIGYTYHFSPQGPLRSISAESDFMPLTKDSVEISTNPETIIELLAGWQLSHSPQMSGIIWFRLPIASDRHNWKWVTLNKVMQGIVPTPRIETTTQRISENTSDITIVNTGSGNLVGSLHIRVTGMSGSLSQWDGVGGFEVIQVANDELRFIKNFAKLRPGESETIGWVQHPKETKLHATEIPQGTYRTAD